MAINNGIDWEKAYGEKWSSMTEEQKDVAIVGMFNTLKKGQELSLLRIESFCAEQSAKNSRFEKAFWLCIFGIPGAFAVLTVLATTLINHISH